MSVKNDVQEVLTEIEGKLQGYRDAHNGKSPARIFISNETYLLFSRALVISLMEPLMGPIYYSGVPVVVFGFYDGPGIFLSNEEAADERDTV